MSDVDDLDALLDDAISTVDANDKKISDEQKQRDNKADELMSELAASFQDNNNNNMPSAVDADMMKALGELMGVLGKGPEFLDNAPPEEMERVESMLRTTLQSIGQRQGLTSADKNALDDCYSLLHKIKEEEEATGQGEYTAEQISTMQKELQALLPNMNYQDLNISDSDIGRRLGSGEEGSSGGGGGSSGGGSSSDIPSDAAMSLFKDILQPEILRDPFIALKDAFGPWLAANRARLSEGELHKYECQYRLAREISELVERDGLCEILTQQLGVVPGMNNNDNKEASRESEEEVARKTVLLDRFSELVAELQTYGEPPKDLFPEESVNINNDNK
eukprot:Tbor_TRINITY_DN4772_c0_g1::TRINITY_DN4772_c0_g1_i1::g.17088::m.17088